MCPILENGKNKVFKNVTISINKFSGINCFRTYGETFSAGNRIGLEICPKYRQVKRKLYEIHRTWCAFDYNVLRAIEKEQYQYFEINCD